MKKVILLGLSILLLSFTGDVRTYDASYYSDYYNGRKTSSGEIFSQHKLTAASNNYPLGTKVKVTNQSNGKSVDVTINDRMAKKFSHRIDLSKAAFKELEPLNKGIIKKVKVEKL